MPVELKSFISTERSLWSVESFRITRSPKLVLMFTLVVFAMVGAVVAALIWVPWRQTVIGQGEVAVFDPLDRPQTIDSQIKGRLVELLVKEGQLVEKGQVIARLEDRDSKFLDPAQQQRIRGQIEALEAKQDAARRRITTLRGQLEAIEASKQAKLASNEAKVAQNQQKLVVNRQLLAVGDQDLETARLQENRIKTLEESGLKSRRDYELTIQKRVEAETKLQKMRGELVLNQQEIQLSELEAATIVAEAQEKAQKAEESIAKAQEGIAEIDEKLEKLRNEAGAFAVRYSLRTLEAPQAGRIVNLTKLGVGQLIKEGQTVARVVPENHSRGVELFLSGLDAPLVETGVPVRLMFEGFPAVPLAGWDWAAVGTFGGIVVAVDPVSSNKEEGKDGFRVWVLPDPKEPEWPSDKRLRLGAKASGWLMLNKVPLYFELWRQLNAFPALPVQRMEKDGGPKPKPVIRR
jgi:multidrug resistance efflux pump